MKRSSRRTGIRRRALLQASASALAVPYFVPAHVLGAGGATPPSEQLTLGVIGYGNRCRHVLGHFMTFPDVRALAICDVQQRQRLAAQQRVNKQYGNNDCRIYNDFREMLACDDIDTILLATGDRWHALGSLYAARAGKDMYSEKPICLTIAEGRAVADTLGRLGTIYQAGHQRRSVDSYKFQREVVQRERKKFCNTHGWGGHGDGECRNPVRRGQQAMGRGRGRGGRRPF